MAHRARLTWGALLVLGLVIAVGPTWTGVGTVDDTPIPLPAPAIRIGAQSWIVPGRRDVAGFLREAAPPQGWAIGEQLGSMHTLHRPGRTARLTQRIVASVFTRIDAAVGSTAP